MKIKYTLNTVNFEVSATGNFIIRQVAAAATTASTWKMGGIKAFIIGQISGELLGQMQKSPGKYKANIIIVPNPAAPDSQGEVVTEILKLEKDEHGKDVWIKYGDPIVR